MDALGKQYIVELKQCNREKLEDEKLIKDLMKEAAYLAGATVINHGFNKLGPGVSGMIIIAESHIAIHTWPEYGYAAVDIFTCGDKVKPEKALLHLIDNLDCEDYSIIELKRGTIIVDGKLDYKKAAVT